MEPQCHLVTGRSDGGGLAGNVPGWLFPPVEKLGCGCHPPDSAWTPKGSGVLSAAAVDSPGHWPTSIVRSGIDMGAR